MAIRIEIAGNNGDRTFSCCVTALRLKGAVSPPKEDRNIAWSIRPIISDGQILQAIFVEVGVCDGDGTVADGDYWIQEKCAGICAICRHRPPTQSGAAPVRFLPASRQSRVPGANVDHCERQCDEEVESVHRLSIVLSLA